MTKKNIHDYNRYLYPYFAEFIDYPSQTETKRRLTKLCIKNGNIDALHQWHDEDCLRFLKYSLKYKKFDIFEYIFDKKQGKWEYLPDDPSPIILAKKYELFDKYISFIPKTSYKYDIALRVIFYSSDLEFIKKYFPCPKTIKLSRQSVKILLATNCKEVMDYTNVERHIESLNIHQLVQTGNIDMIKKYCHNFRTIAVVRGAAYSNSVEVVNFVVSRGAKLNKILSKCAFRYGKKILLAYSNELSKFDKRVWLQSLCRKSKFDFDLMLKLASIDDIISFCFKFENYNLLHKIIEKGYEFTGEIEQFAQNLNSELMKNFVKMIKERGVPIVEQTYLGPDLAQNA